MGKRESRAHTLGQRQRGLASLCGSMSASATESIQSRYPTGMIVVTLYFPVVGVLFTVLEEQWRLQDTIYFMTMTLMTVGYGDVTPSTSGGRLLAVGYMLFNVCCLSFFVKKVLRYVSTKREMNFVNGLDNDVSMEAPEAESASFLAGRLRLVSGFKKITKHAADSVDTVASVIADADSQENSRRSNVQRHIGLTVILFLVGTAGFRYMGFGGCEEPTCDLDPTTDDTAQCLPGCRPTCLCTQDAAVQGIAGFVQEPVDELIRDPSTDRVELVRLQFDNFSHCPAACWNTSKCDGTATPVPRRKGICPISAFQAGTCGARVEALTKNGCSEHQEWIDALYVATYTMTTVGFGDIAGPLHWHGRIFVMLFSISSTLMLTTAVANSVDYLHSKDQRSQMKNMFSNAQYLKHLICSMHENNDKPIDQLEFVSFMLIRQQKVTAEDLQVLRDQFSVLDSDKNGVLTLEDIIHKDQEAEHALGRDLQ